MDDICSCCKNLFKETDQVFSTPCGHIFHRDCLFVSTFVLSNENKSSCPICSGPCTRYDTERLFICPSMSSKKESAICDIEHQITKKKFQIQRSINRNNRSTEKFEELTVLMERAKETEKKIDQIKMQNVRKVQNPINTEKKESPSIVAKIKLKRNVPLQKINDEVEILDIKLCNMSQKLT